MKLSALVSFVRPAVLVLLPLLLIGWAEHVAAHPVHHQHLSQPLQNVDTHRTVIEVSRRAQTSDSQDDVRVMPSVNMSQHHMTICCLHANILDFYLNKVLPHHDGSHDHMHRLRTDLSRVSEDLQAHRCNETRYHGPVDEFRTKFEAMGENRIKKAVGEIDILFSSLADFCFQPSNATGRNAQ